MDFFFPLFFFLPKQNQPINEEQLKSPPLTKMIVGFLQVFFSRGEVTRFCLNAMIRVSGKQK